MTTASSSALPHFVSSSTDDGRTAAAVSDPFCLPPGRDQRILQDDDSQVRPLAGRVAVAAGRLCLPPATLPTLAIQLAQLERHLPPSNPDAADILLNAQLIVNSAHRVALLGNNPKAGLMAQNALGELDTLLTQQPPPMPSARTHHLNSGASTLRAPSQWTGCQEKLTDQAPRARGVVSTLAPPIVSKSDTPVPTDSAANQEPVAATAFEDDKSTTRVDAANDQAVAIRGSDSAVAAEDVAAWNEIEFDKDDDDDEHQGDSCPALAEIPLDDLLSTSYRTILVDATAKFASQPTTSANAHAAAIGTFIDRALTTFCAGQRPTSFDRKSFVELNQEFLQAYPAEVYSIAMATIANEMVDRLVRVMQYGPEKQLASLAYDLVRQRNEYAQGELSLAVYVECVRRLPAVWNVIMPTEEERSMTVDESWTVKDSVLMALWALMSSAYRMQDIAKPLFLSPIACWLQAVLIDPSPSTTLPPSILQQALPLVLDLSGAVLHFHTPAFFSTVLDRARTRNLIPPETEVHNYHLAQSLPWEGIAEQLATKPTIEWPLYNPARSAWPTEYLKANGATLVCDTAVLKMHHDAVECVDPPGVSPIALVKELDIVGLVNDCWVGMRETVAGIRRAVRETKETLTLARRWGRRTSQDGGQQGSGKDGSAAEATVVTAEQLDKGKAVAVMAMGLLLRSLHKRVFSQPGFFESSRFPFVVQALISLLAVDAYRSAFLRIVMEHNSSLLSAFTTSGVSGEPRHNLIWIKLWVSLCTTLSWAGDNNHLFVTPLFCAIENAFPSLSTATPFATELVQHILGDAQAGAVMNQFDNDRYHALVDRLGRHSQSQALIRFIRVHPSYPSGIAAINLALSPPSKPVVEPAPAAFASSSAALASKPAFFSFRSESATPAPEATPAGSRLSTTVADSTAVGVAPASTVAAAPQSVPVETEVNLLAEDGERPWWDMSPEEDPIPSAYALPPAASLATLPLPSMMDAPPMFASPPPTPATSTASVASAFNHQHAVDRFDAILLSASKRTISMADATQRIQATVNASYKDNTNQQMLSALLESILTTGIKPECRMPASRTVRSCLVCAPGFAPMFWNRIEAMSPVLSIAPMASHMDIQALGKEADLLSFFTVLYLPESLAEANVEMPVEKLRAAINRILGSPNTATYAACLGAMIHAAPSLFIPSASAFSGSKSPSSPASLSMSTTAQLPLSSQEQETLLVRIVREYLPHVPLVHVAGWSGSDPKTKLQEMLRQVGVL